MSPYLTNKIVSIGVPALLILTGLFFYSSDDPHYWWYLLVAAQSGGFIHYILGFKYQYTALVRKEQKDRLRWFYILTALSFFLVFLVYMTDVTLLFIALGVPYFILHGSINEHTLVKKQTIWSPKLSQFIWLGVFVTGFFFLSYRHPSFVMDVDMFSIQPELFVAYFNFFSSSLFFESFKYMAIGCFALFSFFIPFQLWRSKERLGAFLVFILALSAAGTVLSMEPMHYVVLLALALLYHFISWSFFYYQEFKKNRPEKVTGYIIEHVVIGVPLLFLASSSLGGATIVTELSGYVFNGYLFFALTTAHISASFVNDEWFHKLVRIS